MSNNEDVLSQIPDVPRGGPLEDYRKKASFNWKKIKLFFEDFELYKFKKHIWETLRNDPLFIRPLEDPPLDKQKEIAQKRVKRLNEYAFQTKEDLYEYPLKRIYFDEAIVMWDIDCSIKYTLNFQMFGELLAHLGTERHAHLVKQCENLEIFGCFAMTEMKHGSNTKEIQTTARYDPKTEEFIINTPTFEDSKVWVGNLGKTATHAAVYAQLITPDNVCHGMHIFIVPVRDPITMYALPGVIVGDLGPKIGLNGIDNGFVTFNQVRIPRDNLLNRTGDVSPDGTYITPFKDPNKRFGISLGALSNGRVGLTYFSYCFMNMALTIAIRYAATRRQFGSQAGQETPIIEYQLHQYRLFPSLAVCYILKNYAFSLFSNLVEFYVGMMSNDTSDRQAEFGKEIHTLSSATKPYASWLAQGVIQECREACGGHGYLKASRFGYLRDTNDPVLTFEGDNNVLIQQTSNHLLTEFEEYLKTKKLQETPLNTLDFLMEFELKLKQKFVAMTKQDLLHQSTIMQMFDWLLCYMLKSSHDKLTQSLKSGKDSFTARNDNQVFFSKTLAIVFIERQFIERFIRKISENTDTSLNQVLGRILHLGALYMLDRHTAIFYQGGYFTSDKPVSLIRDTIIDLCGEMKNEALSLVDAMAPPDFVLNSALGDASGNAYKKLYSLMIQSPQSLEPIQGHHDDIKPHFKSNL